MEIMNKVGTHLKGILRSYKNITGIYSASIYCPNIRADSMLLHYIINNLSKKLLYLVLNMNFMIFTSLVRDRNFNDQTILSRNVRQ
jgi:hypothetical protein